MSYTAGILLKAGTAYLSRPSEFTPGFLVGFVLLNIYFYSVLSTIVCLYALVIVFSVLSFTSSDYHLWFL
jgi:hypothetical protein